MIEKIQKMLIHALGGVTVEESRQSDVNSYEMGALMVAQRGLRYAKELNGLNGDEWCDKMYKYLVEEETRRSHPGKEKS